MKYLWLDGMRTGELARLISLSENQLEDRPDQAYLAGLLHNMGLLIFMSRGCDKMERLIALAKEDDGDLIQFEADIFGFNRFEAAAYVLSLWKIPPRITEAILLQNTPSKSDYDGVNALTALHVAACLLKPPVMRESAGLFDMTLDADYLERIKKFDRLPDWQILAEKVIKQYGGKA